MIKVINVFICLCAAVYMLMRFKQGAGVMEIDIPSGYFRDSLNGFGVCMHEMYHFVLCLLCFECLTLVLPMVYNRFLKARFSVVKRICSAFPYLRLCADICCMALTLFLIAVTYLLSHDRKSFELVDENGCSTILVRDLGSEQE